MFSLCSAKRRASDKDLPVSKNESLEFEFEKLIQLGFLKYRIVMNSNYVFLKMENVEIFQIMTILHFIS